MRATHLLIHDGDLALLIEKLGPQHYLTQRASKLFADLSDPKSNWFRGAARHFQVDGELEIDDHPLVSRGVDTDGAYVHAWVWVDGEVEGELT